MRRGAWMAALAVVLSCRPAPEPDDPAEASRGAAADSSRPVAAIADTAPTGDCLPLWPAKVSLSGIHRTEERQGPPGYGETPEQDADLTIHLVELDSPHDVCGGNAIPDQPAEPIAGVTTIQLVGILHESWLDEAVGRRIAVHGDLELAVSGGHFFPIVMAVDSAAPAW